MRALAAAIAVFLGAPAAEAGVAPVTHETVPGAPGPGPEEYDQVHLTKIGPADAERVLILMPGNTGRAGDFTLLGQDLVGELEDLQVWAVDRREQALEDTSKFEEVIAGTATPQDALDYYLGWLTDPSIQPHYQPLDDQDYPFTQEWGLRRALNGFRELVKMARRDGR